MFDPFKDFEVRGYLRNIEGLKDPQGIKLQENIFFQAQLEEALGYLSRVRGPLRYSHFKGTHQRLFGGFYPWAGRDRAELGVAPMVSKGATVQFAHADEIERSMAWGLGMGNDPQKMARCPGEVMGAFAWAHPFLDGNGRTMLLVHAELCKRAGIRIDWPATDKSAYLRALTDELIAPGTHPLDGYLRPFVLPASRRARLLDELKGLPGLDGLDSLDGSAPNVPDIAYSADDAVALQQYAETKRRRAER